MELRFKVRGTRGGNCVIAWADGRETSVATDGTGADLDRLVAQQYFAKHPDGETIATGTVTISAEID